jgi:hypothetical protein
VLTGPKRVSYTQDSSRKCCAAEGLPGRAIGRNRYRDSPLRGVPLLIALRLGKVSIAERRESREAVGYDGSSRIFFDH